jgi:GT2 family glycosyltransferase
MSAGPDVSVVITTRNRKSELLRALESCRAQRDVSHEILVYDDDSSDGTSQDVARLYPEVRVITGRQREGLIVCRNRAARIARGRIIVSIDDDAYFTDATTLKRATMEFDRFPQAGALALHYIEPQRIGDCARHTQPSPGTPLRSYIGCAHAVHRELFLELGGYRDLLVHQGEERDFCIRMLDAGWQVILADTPPIVHDVSPHRDVGRMTYYGYRNTLLFSTLNVPASLVLPQMLKNTLQLLLHRPRRAAQLPRIQGLLSGWASLATRGSNRRPVKRETFRMYRSLAMHTSTACPADELPQPVSRLRDGSVATRREVVSRGAT